MRTVQLATVIAIALMVPAWPLPMATAAHDAGPLVHAPRPIVVIAHIDSGANVYHEAFRDSSDLAFQHPCTYIAGYPCGAQALNLSLAAPTFDEAFAADVDLWESVKTSSIVDQRLYWIPGTKVIGAIRFGSGGTNAPVVPVPPASILNFVRPEWPILDEHGHGTMTATRMAGNAGSLCDSFDCRVVIIEGLGGVSTRWAAEQGWIDVQTNSWLSLIPPPVSQNDGSEDPYGTTQAFKFAQDKMLTYAASGNGAGYINGFVPTPTELLSTAAPGVLLVGAHDNGYADLWSGAPAHLVADGYGGKHAPNNTLTGYVETPVACCSSASSPYAAGGGARVVLEARRLLDDTGTGLRNVSGLKAIAVNTSRAGLFGGPLGDGILTLDEAKALVKHTAEARPATGINDGLLHWAATGDLSSPSASYIPLYGPGANPYCQGCWASPVKWTDVAPAVAAYGSIGYGAVNERSVALAASVLAGTAPEPARAAEDLFFAVESLVREPLFTEIDFPDTPDLDDLPIPKDPILGSGTIHAGNPATGFRLGVTEVLWLETASLAAQGVDAVILSIPPGSAGKTLYANGTSPADDSLGHDLDIYFHGADRKYVGVSSATGAANESAPVPAAAAYVVVDLFLGADVAVTVEIA